jgi:hypothetical protein
MFFCDYIILRGRFNKKKVRVSKSGNNKNIVTGDSLQRLGFFVKQKPILYGIEKE